MKLPILTCAALAVLVAGCKDEKLEAAYQQLEGKYKLLQAEYERLQSEKIQVEAARSDLLSQLEKMKTEEQERKSRISPLQRQQLAKLLDSGSRVNAAVAAGVTLMNFRELHAAFNGDVALVASNWPRSLPEETKKKLQEAAECWSFSQEVWGAKIQYEDDFPGFFVSDTPIPAPLKHLVKTFIYTDLTGSKHESASWIAIQIGLTVGSQQFEAAQSKLLNELNE